MDFRQYSENKKNEKTKNTGNDRRFGEEEVRRTYDDTVKRMRGKSQKELMDEIVKEADKARREGRLDGERLKNFYDTVEPMLDKNQLKKLKEIISVIDVGE